jgi:hypothetical protein
MSSIATACGGRNGRAFTTGGGQGPELAKDAKKLEIIETN